MTTNDLTSSISTALQAFASTPLRKAAIELFTKLGYSSERTLATGSVADFCVQFDPKHLLAAKADKPAITEQWQSIALLFQLTDEELSSSVSLFKDTTVSSGLMRSYVFFAIELKPSSNANDYARGKLAAITRQINRLFPMPVMVLFKVPSQQGDKLSLAVINRRTHKRDDSRDVMGKVTLIQNINIAQPHRGHLDILASFSVPKLQSRKTPIGNFDELHAAWETVFNVELLNKRFYEELSNWFFWARKQVSFPDDLDKNEGNRNATSVIRLLTRLIFCWFLKEKDLIPDRLFDVDELKEVLTKFDALDSGDSTYYRAILQNLFFATLNQPMNVGSSIQRRFAVEGTFHEQKEDYGNDALYRYADAFKDSARALALFEDIPLLNGGLFSSLDSLDDKGKKQYADGFSRTPKKQAFVPNHLFFAPQQDIDLSADYGDAKKKKAKVRGLIHILQSYKFTIAESTPVEQEIALDPELLGNVFENLLASYNPETKESARKQTGSFYTPRPIVDYMVDESLKAYLARALRAALPKTTELDAKTGLDILFAYTERQHVFTKPETTALINAIDACNILDPACGSGAYPMGILHKLVFILGKLDPSNAQWKQRQIDKAEEMPDSEARESAVRAIERDFADNNLDYGRKLYLIENCIYGVDIQPIAIQISKLRFFISLVCDQKTSMDKSRNRGVRPLPNLEIKFVAANTLMGLNLPKNLGLFDNATANDLELDLEKVRHHYFAAQTRKKKLELQKRDRELTKKILIELLHDDSSNEDVRRRVLWNPYDPHSVADFFDPAKMFGPSMAAGFDVVIGNPPYVRQESIKDLKSALKPHYPHSYAGTADLYVYFYERAFQFLKPDGCLSFITSNKWFRAKYGAGLREFMTMHTKMHQIIDFGDEAVFEALAYPTIVIATKRVVPLTAHTIKTDQSNVTVLNWDCRNPTHKVADFQDVFVAESFPVPQNELSPFGWQLEPPIKRDMLKRIKKAGIPLGDYCKGRFYRGVLTGLNEAFVILGKQRAELITQDPKSAAIIKPFLRGRDVKRWNVDFGEQYLIKLESSENVKHPWSGLPAEQAEQVFAKTHPWIYHWFTADNRRQQLIDRSDQGHYFWEMRSCAYWQEFEQSKIVFPDIALSPQFAWDAGNHYLGNTAYIIPRVDRWLLAVLNSPVTAWFYAQISPQIQNGYYRFIAQYVELIPVPGISESQKALIESLIGAIEASIHAPEFERLLNGLVYELFFPNELHDAKITLFEACAVAGIGAGMDAQAVAATVFKSEHPIYGMLFDLQGLDVVRTIQGNA